MPTGRRRRRCWLYERPSPFRDHCARRQGSPSIVPYSPSARAESIFRPGHSSPKPSTIIFSLFMQVMRQHTTPNPRKPKRFPSNGKPHIDANSDHLLPPAAGSTHRPQGTSIWLPFPGRPRRNRPGPSPPPESPFETSGAAVRRPGQKEGPPHLVPLPRQRHGRAVWKKKRIATKGQPIIKVYYYRVFT